MAPNSAPRLSPLTKNLTQRIKEDKKPSAQKAPVQSGSSSSSDIEYTTSSDITLGEEGYQIGVGVSDHGFSGDATMGFGRFRQRCEIWATLTRWMVAADVKEGESTYICSSRGADIGSVSGLSQGLNVILKRDDGWSSSKPTAMKTVRFIRGYISSKLRTVDPNTSTASSSINRQTLTVYKDGERVGFTAVSTGKPPIKSLSVKRRRANSSP